jgi:uncharacterized membrane protein YqaE (UPF0057 family)
MNKFYLPLILILVAALSSCGALRVEKRHYRGGFYVDFNNNKTENVTPAAKEDVAVINEENPAPVNVTEESPKSTEAAAKPSEEQHNTQATKTSEKSSDSPEAISLNLPSVDQPSSDKTSVEEPASENNAAPDSDVMLIVLVILAIIIPPLAVYLKEGLTGRFWLILILSILGGGFFFYPVIGGLFLLAIILALLIVLDIM